ncbi:MAG: alpha/beta fold hydrolase [Myxococcota bacterium]
MRALRWTVLGLGVLAALLYVVGLGIYAVASTAPDVPSQPATPEEAREAIRSLGLAEEYPFESRFVSTPHGRMHYVDAGQGSPILCVHGNPTWSFLYRNFVKGLSDSHRVVAVDLIGFGLSEKPSDPDDYSILGHVEDLSRLVETLDLRNVTLVMQDWGGPIGLGVALRYPERIRALVVMNTIGFVPEGNGGPPFALRILRAPLLGEELVQGLGLFNRVFVPAAIVRDERKDELVRRAYVEVQGTWDDRAGTLAFPRLIPTGPHDPVVGLLEQEDRYVREFRGPVLLAWGLRDRVFSRSILEQWRERVPQASVLELPDAGHFLQEDAHELIVPRIRKLLADAE